ncbi:hypothetical protein VTL71DRAFT_5587 [Oculimacula yallundae]|uniref:Uncharacterized protein n=1 Tax=Oculimacula yallundae TaxID=86028 RepID=A0ABR4C2M3_9HELO
MSFQPNDPRDGSTSSPYIHMTSPAILFPAEVIGNIVSRANELITGHREWLSNLPVQKEEAKRQMAAVPPVRPPAPPAGGIVVSSTRPPTTSNPGPLTTLFPLPGPPLQGPPLQGPAAASASITSLQSALSSANGALARATQSASLALATQSASLQAALSSASIQSQSALAASQSANVAIASAQSSATQAIAAVQSSASASILLANNALSSAQFSASAAVSSANSLASVAQASATSAIAQAQSSISAVASQASSAIAASRISAMNRTTFVLVITFSIIGSSLITALIFFLIIRFRRNRRSKRLDEMKTTIHRRRHESEESAPPSLSEFPLPINRSRFSRRMSARFSDRGSLRTRGAGDAGYWPQTNERVSATDRERAAWQRSPSSLREMVVRTPEPQEPRKTWAVGSTPFERDPAAKPERASESYIQGNSPGINDSLNRQTWSPSKDRLPQSQGGETLVNTPAFPSGRGTLSRGTQSREGLLDQRSNFTATPVFAPGMGSPTRDRPTTSGQRLNTASTPVSGPSAAPSMYPPSREGTATMVRKNTLTYDAEYPDQPPKFASWLEQSIRSVSPFPTRTSAQAAAPESKRTSAALGRRSVRVETRKPFEETRDSDGSAIIGAAM